MVNERLNICMFSNLFPPVVSGSSTQTMSLSRELVKLGHSVVVITAKVIADSLDYEVTDGIHVYRMNAFKLPRMGIAFNFPWLSFTFTPFNIKRIKEIINKHDCRIIHLHNHMFDLAFSAVKISKALNKSLFLTVHTVIKHSNPMYNLFLFPIDRFFLKNTVIKNVDHIICPDINIQEYVYEAFGNDNETEIIPYGINFLPAPHDDDIDKLQKKYNLTGKRVILSLGHVHDIRNRKDIVEALPYILKKYPDTVLLVVGTVATDIPSMTACKLGVQESVVFTGAVPYSLVPAYIALADIEAHWLTQDSVDKTSLGIATLETMGAGKTIISAANENTHGPGVLKNGENLILVEPHEPEKLGEIIIELLGNENRRTDIGEKAKDTIETHFSWDSVCTKTLDLYRGYLNKGR